MERFASKEAVNTVLYCKIGNFTIKFFAEKLDFFLFLMYNNIECTRMRKNEGGAMMYDFQQANMWKHISAALEKIERFVRRLEKENKEKM